MSLLENLIRWAPNRPREMQTVFAGTSTRADGWHAIRDLLISRAGKDQRGELASALGDATGCHPAALFGAGRMGLYAILEALEFREGDEIILPAFTCAVVPNAMVYRGIRPVYVDIEPRTFNIDPAGIERAITPRTRAIYAQHTFGAACDLDAIAAIASVRKLLVIEDLAHALGATHRGRQVGSFGDASFGSSDRTKVINTHIGGWASSRHDDVAERLRAAAARAPELSRADQRRAALAFALECIGRDPGLLWIGRPALGALRRMGVEFVWRDEQMDTKPDRPAYPCRFPRSLGAPGVEQMRRLSDNLAHRRMIAAWLEERVAWNRGMPADQFQGHAWLRYSMLVKDREAFIARFGRRIDLGTWFTEPIFGRPTSAASVGYRSGSCPVAERVAAHIVNFPTHPRISPGFLEARFSEHGGWLADQVIRDGVRG